MKSAPISLVGIVFVGLMGATAIAAERARVDRSKVTIISFNWHSQHGIRAGLEIQNLNTFAVHDIVIRCTRAIKTGIGYDIKTSDQTLTKALQAASTMSVQVSVGASNPHLIAVQCRVIGYTAQGQEDPRHHHLGRS